MKRLQNTGTLVNTCESRAGENVGIPVLGVKLAFRWKTTVIGMGAARIWGWDLMHHTLCDFW